MDKIVSIIVPVYNVAIYHPKCLDSLVSQTFRNIEIILVNDGSTDSSGLVCKEYAAKDTRITYIEKANEGVSRARNYGLMNAKGEYISFIDADDYVDKDFIRTMVEAMEENGCDLICCGCNRETADGRLLWQRKAETTTRYGKKQAIQELFTPTSYVGWPWNKLYKASIIRENNIYFKEDLRYCEDEVFVLEYLLHASQGACYIHNVLYHYVENMMSANLKIVTERKFDFRCLDRQKADEVSYLLVKQLGDKEIMDTFLARRFTSNMATLEKLMVGYNNEYDILVRLRANLRKYYLKYLLNKRFDKSIRQEIKHVICLINPIIYIKIKSKR